MIIFDDLASDKETIAHIREYVSHLEFWESSPEDPLISRISLMSESESLFDISDKISDFLHSFAHRNRIDVSQIISMDAIKLSHKANKEEIDYEKPVFNSIDDLTVVLFLNTSNAHMFIFNEGEGASEEDLTVYTMFSPVEGRGFVLDTSKYHAFSLPGDIENQYLVKIQFSGKLVSNQASTVYDLEN